VFIFHVLRFITHFWRYQSHYVQFSYFFYPELISKVVASDPTVLVFNGLEVSTSIFHVLHSKTVSIFHVLRFLSHFRRPRDRCVYFLHFTLLDLFRRFRGRYVHFLGFTLPDLFSTVPEPLHPFFWFFTPRDPCVYFSRFKLIDSFFTVLGRYIYFSSFAIRDSFFMVLRLLCLIFHILRSCTHF
jgi:hypothetical protein